MVVNLIQRLFLSRRTKSLRAISECLLHAVAAGGVTGVTEMAGEVESPRRREHSQEILLCNAPRFVPGLGSLRSCAAQAQGLGLPHLSL